MATCLNSPATTDSRKAASTSGRSSTNQRTDYGGRDQKRAAKGLQEGGAASMVLVRAVDCRNERAGVEKRCHAERFIRSRIISSCRSERSPRPESQIPMIDNLRAAACSLSGLVAGASSGSVDPAEFGVTVTSGVVTISGQMPRPNAVLELLARIRHTEGVVAVPQPGNTLPGGVGRRRRFMISTWPSPHRPPRPSSPNHPHRRAAGEPVRQQSMTRFGTPQADADGWPALPLVSAILRWQADATHH